MRQCAFDLFLLYGIGILGPLAEAQMRNAISIGEGSAMIFLQRPMSLSILAVVLLILLLPRALKWNSSQLKQQTVKALRSKATRIYQYGEWCRFP